LKLFERLLEDKIEKRDKRFLLILVKVVEAGGNGRTP
jgi:hypothetical protein